MAVAALEVKTRQALASGRDFGSVGRYTQLDGTAHFAVDPAHPLNGCITDIDLAPRDGNGLVHFSADIRILTPADPRRGNHRVLFDVPNRGNRLALATFNRVRRPIMSFQPSAPSQVQLLSDRGHRPYSSSELDDPGATLLVRDGDDAPPRVIPRQEWSFARLDAGRVVPDADHVYLAAGFAPGKVYHVIYTTTGAPVIGLGLLAARDTVAFLRHGTAKDGNPCTGDIRQAFAFGASQSGRYLRQFLYLGLNEDEQERTVFDGVLVHIAGGKRGGDFNQRFGQPSASLHPTMSNAFPFNDTASTDPVTGCSDGLLERLSARRRVPKIFFTNSSTEYWREHGVMSLEACAQISTAALDAGIAPIARVPNGEYAIATRALDNGALGIVMPHVDSAAEARDVVNRLKYPPVGHRSMGGIGPHYGLRSASSGEAAAALNAANLTIVMLETPTAIANAEEIAAVPGIDVLLIGTNDLCSEMGIHGDFGNERVADAYQTMIAAARKHGKFPGMAGVYNETIIPRYVEMGARFVLGGQDAAFMAIGAAQRTGFLRKLSPGSQ